MRGFLIAAALGLVLLGAGVPTAGSALAEERNDHRSYGGKPVYNFLGALIYGSPRQGYRPDYRRKRHDYRSERREYRSERREYRGDRRYNRPAPHRAHRDRDRKRHTYYKPRRKYSQGRRDYQVVRPCRATSKIGFDGYGRRARIGGTMCYDAYGTPYIVRGSRYIIQVF